MNDLIFEIGESHTTGGRLRWKINLKGRPG